MCHFGQSLQQPEDGGYAYVVAIGQVNPLQRQMPFDKRIKRGVGDACNLTASKFLKISPEAVSTQGIGARRETLTLTSPMRLSFGSLAASSVTLKSVSCEQHARSK